MHEKMDIFYLTSKKRRTFTELFTRLRHVCIHLRIKNGGASKAPARAGCCIYFFSIAGWRRNSARRETRRALKPPPSRSVGECPALYRMRGWPLTYAHRGCFDMRRDSVFRLQQSVATRMMGRSHPPGDAHVAADVRHGAAQGIVPLTWLGVLMIWHERPETVRGLRRPVKDKKTACRRARCCGNDYEPLSEGGGDQSGAMSSKDV